MADRKQEIFFDKMRDKIKNMTKQHRQEFLIKAENNKKLDKKSCCWLENMIDLVNQEEFEVSQKHAENIPQKMSDIKSRSNINNI